MADTGNVNVDTLEAEIIAALPRSVDDPAWESPTAAKIRDLAARAREADDTSVFHWQNEILRCQHERDAAERERDAARRQVDQRADWFAKANERAEAAKAERDRLARRVAELEAEREAFLAWKAALAGDGGGA